MHWFVFSAGSSGEPTRSRPTTFRSSPLVHGVGSVIDLSGRSDLRLTVPGLAHPDALALHRDWEAVGRDLWVSMAKLEKDDPQQETLFDPSEVKTEA